MRDFSQYPSQNSAYAIKVKNGAGWRAYKTARLQISVGGDRHEGEKFKATVDWVRNRFDKVIICVNDTLQRHNMLLDGLSEEQAYSASLEQGRAWLLRHIREINTLPGYEIYRWEEWKVGPQFHEAYTKTCALFNDNTLFRRAVEESMKNQQSKDYLLEEVAVFSVMYGQCKAVDIYPGTLPPALEIFKQHKIFGAPDHLSEGLTTRIDFKRNEPVAA